MMNSEAVLPGYQSGFPTAFPELMSPFQFSRLLLIRWEDESTQCYQVEENSICVARRRDNNMINGTKLLNVAKMTRGKRDAILKNETARVVVKSGSMILKGVWIPMERAKKLAREHKVYDLLYPLFESDIHKIYQSSIQSRRASIMGPIGPIGPFSPDPLNISNQNQNQNQNYLDQLESMDTLDPNLNFIPRNQQQQQQHQPPQYKVHRAMSDAGLLTHHYHPNQLNYDLSQFSASSLDSMDMFPNRSQFDSQSHHHQLNSQLNSPQYSFLPMPNYHQSHPQSDLRTFSHSSTTSSSSTSYQNSTITNPNYDLGLGLHFESIDTKSNPTNSTNSSSYLPTPHTILQSHVRP